MELQLALVLPHLFLLLLNNLKCIYYDTLKQILVSTRLTEKYNKVYIFCTVIRVFTKVKNG